jgi:PEP-CTERM motif
MQMVGDIEWLFFEAWCVSSVSVWVGTGPGRPASRTGALQLLKEGKMKKLSILLIVVFALALQVTHVRAIPLGTLIDTNGTITEADKLFSNFKLSNVTISDPLDLTPDDPRDIEIQGFTNLIGEHGLRLVGPFQANSKAPFGSVADLSFFLEYDVSVTNPLFLIHDVRHAFSFTSIGSGSINLITQAGFPPNVNAFIQSVEGFGNNGVVNEDEAFLNDVSSQHMLHVLDFRAETTQPTPGLFVSGAINVSSIDLTFSQVPIPEPSSWLLLGAGIAGLALWRRCQKGSASSIVVRERSRNR